MVLQLRKRVVTGSLLLNNLIRKLMSKHIKVICLTCRSINIFEGTVMNKVDVLKNVFEKLWLRKFFEINNALIAVGARRFMILLNNNLATLANYFRAI